MNFEERILILAKVTGIKMQEYKSRQISPINRSDKIR